MDVDRVKGETDYGQSQLKLQWSHVLMDVDSTRQTLTQTLNAGLQWSHVLMDVDSACTTRNDD